jgi:hypothetical protein
MENLALAYKNAKKGKGWYAEIKEIEKDPEKYLLQLQAMLINHEYHTSAYETFMRKEGRKVREIYKLPFFPDRIAQWAIIQVIEPQLLSDFIGDTYSALPGKGIHAALKKIRAAIDKTPDEMAYCCKIDCQKFYPSIDHEILKTKYRRKFKDPDLLELIDEIIDSVSTCPATEDNIEFYKSCGKTISVTTRENGEKFIDGVGIPIGNYFSQYDGNFYLSSFDHYMKEVLRVKHYYRYMDDVCVFAGSKEELHRILDCMREYLLTRLNLRIKKNYQIFPSYVRGVDFVGYRIFKDYTLLRRSTAEQMKAKMVTIRKKVEAGRDMSYSDWCSINSYKGWLMYCDSYRLSQKYFAPLQLYAEMYYEKYIKSKRGGKNDQSWNS